MGEFINCQNDNRYLTSSKQKSGNFSGRENYFT
jgi:hypothetical protein